MSPAIINIKFNKALQSKDFLELTKVDIQNLAAHIADLDDIPIDDLIWNGKILLEFEDLIEIFKDCFKAFIQSEGYAKIFPYPELIQANLKFPENLVRAWNIGEKIKYEYYLIAIVDNQMNIIEAALGRKLRLDERNEMLHKIEDSLDEFISILTNRIKRVLLNRHKHLIIISRAQSTSNYFVEDAPEPEDFSEDYIQKRFDEYELDLIAPDESPERIKELDTQLEIYSRYLQKIESDIVENARTTISSALELVILGINAEIEANKKNPDANARLSNSPKLTNRKDILVRLKAYIEKQNDSDRVKFYLWWSLIGMLENDNDAKILKLQEVIKVMNAKEA